MYSIDRINEADLDELSVLYEELANKRTDRQKLKENFTWMNSNPDYLLIGAKENGILAGSLLAVICHDVVGECRPFMILENVIVKSNYRDQGI